MFLNVIPELILYIVLGIASIYFIAVLLDYINIKRNISNKKDSYINYEEFIYMVNLFPLNKEKRYKDYIVLLDPVTILFLDSLGYDLSKFEILKSLNDSIDKDFTKYLFPNNQTEKNYTYKEMLDFINGDEFDTQTNWNEFPELVFPAVLNCPVYNKKQQLKHEDIEKVKEQFKNEKNLKKIISNKALTNHILITISAIEKLIKNSGYDSIKKNQLEIKLKMFKIYLDSSINQSNNVKKSIMQKYNE